MNKEILDLIIQIERSDFKDRLGHKLRDNEAYIKLVDKFKDNIDSKVVKPTHTEWLTPMDKYPGYDRCTIEIPNSLKERPKTVVENPLNKVLFPRPLDDAYVEVCGKKVVSPEELGITLNPKRDIDSTDLNLCKRLINIWAAIKPEQRFGFELSDVEEKDYWLDICFYRSNEDVDEYGAKTGVVIKIGNRFIIDSTDGEIMKYITERLERVKER